MARGGRWGGSVVDVEVGSGEQGEGSFVAFGGGRGRGERVWGTYVGGQVVLEAVEGYEEGVVDMKLWMAWRGGEGL